MMTSIQEDITTATGPGVRPLAWQRRVLAPERDAPLVTRSITGEMFNASGQIQPHLLRRIKREQRRERLRSWRPRFYFRIRFMLFPKTQRRFEALEKECMSLRHELSALRYDLRMLADKDT